MNRYKKEDNMMENINNASRTKTISKREIALGVLSKKIHKGDDSVQRFISDDSIVEFKVSSAYNTNAEFTINGDSNWKMWFSQLDPVYIREEDLKLEGGKITVGGDTQLMAKITVRDFIKMVNGRKFKVSIHPDCLAMDFRKNEKCRQFRNTGAVQQHISKALDEERYDDVEGILKVMPMYDLVEVGADTAILNTRGSGCRCFDPDMEDALLEDMMYEYEDECYDDYWEQEAAEEAEMEAAMEDQYYEDEYEQEIMEDAMEEEYYEDCCYDY